jgi:hypothetical protein
MDVFAGEEGSKGERVTHKIRSRAVSQAGRHDGLDSTTGRYEKNVPERKKTVSATWLPSYKKARSSLITASRPPSSHRNPQQHPPSTSFVSLCHPSVALLLQHRVSFINLGLHLNPGDYHEILHAGGSLAAGEPSFDFGNANISGYVPERGFNMLLLR